jgi:DNA-binding MarR family transcriptional regulator
MRYDNIARALGTAKALKNETCQRILKAISRDPGISRITIARRLRVDTAALSYALQRLIDHNLIQVEPHEGSEKLSRFYLEFERLEKCVKAIDEFSQAEFEPVEAAA